MAPRDAECRAGCKAWQLPFLGGLCGAGWQKQRQMPLPPASPAHANTSMYVDHACGVPGRMREYRLARRGGPSRGRRAGADHVDAVCAAEAMGDPTRLTIAS